MTHAVDNRRGIAAILCAISLFVLSDTLMKLAREVMPVGQAVTFRAVFAVLAGLVMVAMFGETRKLALGLRPMVLLRGVLEFSVAIGYMWALGRMPFANLTAVMLASPLIAVALAAIFGLEQVGWRRISAVLVGFVGVLLIVRPRADGFDIAALVAFGSTLFVATRDIMTRRIGADVPATVIVVSTMALVALATLPFGLVEDWLSLWRVETLYLAGSAVLAVVGTYCIVNAYRYADIGVVSGYRYTALIFALAIGFVIWGDVPDLAAFFGMALIGGSGLYTLHRERVRRSGTVTPLEEGARP